MKTWQELLEVSDGHAGGADEPWGPNSRLVRRAATILRQTAYYCHAGQPLADDRVAPLATWVEVLDWLEAHAVTGTHPGALDARYRGALKESPKVRGWWRHATEVFRSSTEIPLPAVARQWTPRQRGLLAELLDDVRWWAVFELVAPELADATYFRELLQWLHAGRLPCGWDGTYPQGRIRVF